jgi:hypothetical protein
LFNFEGGITSTAEENPEGGKQGEDGFEHEQNIMDFCLRTGGLRQLFRLTDRYSEQPSENYDREFTHDAELL